MANREFIDAVLCEARSRIQNFSVTGDSAEIRTVYFGGGTPSLLSPPHLELLCRGLRDIFRLDEIKEWTLEANPATFDLTKASLMRQLGVDRISLGVQSFQNQTLKTLGRDHSPKDAIEAFTTLREAGFKNISVDLMFSIPGQTRESWIADVEQAIALEPEHISAYNLTYEEDTEFLSRHEAGELDADEDRDAVLFTEAISRLTRAGYQHYEISNYAREGFESKHNRAYWAGADYLGLGPGAVSTIGLERSKTLADTAAYVKAVRAGIDTRTEIELFTQEDLRIERIALLLRTREGVPLSYLKPGDSEGTDPVESLTQQGYVQEKNNALILTEKGKALADPITAELI